MAQEIEAKFLNINVDDIVDKLETLGAKQVFPERLLRRCVYDLYEDSNTAWARVRDEVDQVTMTYKNVRKQSLDGVEEVELIINDFELGREFLKALGLKEKAYQETKRMRYAISDEGDEVEFDIDTWPGLKPWVEIEASKPELVRKYAKLLGFDWTDAMFGSADLVYEKVYKVTASWINRQCPILKFGELPDELSPANLR